MLNGFLPTFGDDAVIFTVRQDVGEAVFLAFDKLSDMFWPLFSRQNTFEVFLVGILEIERSLYGALLFKLKFFCSKEVAISDSMEEPNTYNIM